VVRIVHEVNGKDSNNNNNNNNLKMIRNLSYTEELWESTSRILGIALLRLIYQSLFKHLLKI